MSVSSAQAESANSFGGGYTAPNGMNALEVVVVVIVAIIFSLIIASAFRKD